MKSLFDASVRNRILYLEVSPVTMHALIANMQHNGGQMVEYGSPDHIKAERECDPDDAVNIRVRGHVPQGIIQAVDKYGYVLERIELVGNGLLALPEGEHG